MSEKLANEAVVDRAIASIKALRVDGGEVFLRDGQSTSVEVRDGEVENAITRGERGIGVRFARGVGEGAQIARAWHVRRTVAQSAQVALALADGGKHNVSARHAIV